jgi:hypothetical protein
MSSFFSRTDEDLINNSAGVKDDPKKRHPHDNPDFPNDYNKGARAELESFA